MVPLMLGNSHIDSSSHEFHVNLAVHLLCFNRQQHKMYRLGTGFRVKGLGIWGLGIWGLGIRGLGFRVWGLCWVLPP